VSVFAPLIALSGLIMTGFVPYALAQDQQRQSAAVASQSGSATGAAVAAASSSPAVRGLTPKKCRAKYQSAIASGIIKGVRLETFSTTECGPGASPLTLASDAFRNPGPPYTSAPRLTHFPNVVSDHFEAHPPVTARLFTCLEQYFVAKEKNALAGMQWIQKGGGYYSHCNNRLQKGP
jgi:hypothetical protein